MALPNLSGSNIQATYQRVLHTDGTNITDGTGSEVLSANELTSLQAIGDSTPITSTEWVEIKNIGAASITGTEWGYLAGVTNVNWTHLATINQGLGTAYSPSFNILNANLVWIKELHSEEKLPALTFPVEATALNPHMSTAVEGVKGPSIYLGDQDGDVITFVNADSDVVSRISQEGYYYGPSTGLTGTPNIAVGTLSTTGNTTFGNAAADTHTFTGHITASGMISASSYLIGIRTTTNRIDVIDGNDLYLSCGLNIAGTNHVTASGDISASGTIYGNNLHSATLTNGRIVFCGNTSGRLGDDADLTFANETLTVTKIANIDTTHVTASGEISSSGTVIGGGLNINGTTTFNDGNITNVGNINLDTIQDEGENGTFLKMNPTNIGIDIAEVQDVITFGAGGHITASGNISASGNIYSDNVQYWSTTGRLVIPNNTTNYAGPNAQGVNYYYWNRDLGTSATTITGKTSTLNSGWKLPYKAILTGYHLNIQGRASADDIEFTLVYCDGMWDGNVTSTSQTLVAAESGQTITIAAANNFYELDRRDQFEIPLSAMSMLYPRFRKTSAADGTTNYDFQLAVQYRIVK